MTANEIQMLVCGIGIGAQGMAIWEMVRNMRASRRGRTESETARKQAAGDVYLSSLRLYQLQHRTRA
ncbi:hypothetical protein [Streptomyces prunicolor]|uniref:Uncharacterized protein n=1 Tax=Streptomyces prunicolor TaxID=67348 RepID=A0ABU4FM34_9ACTN|nr:hypothetical protein [Streptomyces prunicolor]MDV7221016.1 hypothetical protein [Streptomyces prunicolor]